MDHTSPISKARRNPAVTESRGATRKRCHTGRASVLVTLHRLENNQCRGEEKVMWGTTSLQFQEGIGSKVVSLAIVQPDSFEEVISALSIYCSVLSHVGHCCILLSTGCYLFFRHL